MKYRKSFVTNSSSSSFVCDVCGSVETGYDASLSDFDMSRCTNGHEFCNYHAEGLEGDKKQALLELLDATIEYRTRSSYYTEEEVEEVREDKRKLEDGKLDEDEIDDMIKDYGDGEVSPAECPICTMSTIKDDELVQFLLKTLNTTKESARSDIKNAFKSYSEFKTFLSK